MVAARTALMESIFYPCLPIHDRVFSCLVRRLLCCYPTTIIQSSPSVCLSVPCPIARLYVYMPVCDDLELDVSLYTLQRLFWLFCFCMRPRSANANFRLFLLRSSSSSLAHKKMPKNLIPSLMRAMVVGVACMCRRHRRCCLCRCCYCY